jgi:hypothetical protein
MGSRATEKYRSFSDLVTNIPALPRGDLLARWEQYYGTLPHPLTSARLLTMAVAYAVQAEHQGGLPKRLRTELLQQAATSPAKSARTSSTGTRSSAAKRPKSGVWNRPRPGTRFVREWNGRSHVVEVVDKGFAWQGETYRSLSAIACRITGTRWSGPRFFGQLS